MAFKFDVVVSGISGRFPECNDIDTFKKKLYKGNSNEFITSDDRKWNPGFRLNRFGDKAAVPDATGKFKQEIEFDYRMFKYNQLYAKSTDVINRKVSEVSFEAIVDAGINPYSLDGANIGVFFMGGTSETESKLIMANMKNYTFILGCGKTMGPNRLSYALNFTGPSYALCTDPIGGLEALKMAKEQISDGTIEAAVVIAVSNISDPKFSYQYMNLDLLSLEGISRSFDKNANGFVRSESAVAFFLQREQEAKRQYAKLILCDTIFDGLSSHTLLGYDEEYLKNSLNKIYERNAEGTLAEDVAFLELTGSAVKKLESIEANAVTDILCKQRTTPLMVGSVMSCVGHTEAASGLLSVLKTLLVLDSQNIPPNANLSEVNQDIRAIREKKIKVTEQKTELDGNIAAVNTIGLWGMVNHAVFQNNASRKQKNNFDNIPRLILLSGRTAEGLGQVLKKIEFDSFNEDTVALINEVFHKNMPFHIYRGFTILPKTDKMTAVLDESGSPKRPVCFIFSGMGSQWNGMGKQLLDLPIIAEVIKRCDAVLRPKSVDIYKVLLSEDPTIFDDITMSFVGIICIQIALVEVLKKLNIVPNLILGHSVGEMGCAYADGCITVEQAVLGSYARGIASTSTKTIRGMMAAVGQGFEEIKNNLPPSIEVACHNAINSCTLSGPALDVDVFVDRLKKQEIFAKSVNVANIAFHSQYIAPAAPKLLQLLKQIIPEPKKRSSKWISSSIPKSEWHLPLAHQCSAEYLTNNLLKPVLFEEACRHIPKDAICVEIAPHGLLQAILRRSLPETCTNISLTLRSTRKDNLNYLLSSIGKLYVAGCEPAVNNLHPSIKFPVPRGTPSISPYCTWFHGDNDELCPPYCKTEVFTISFVKNNISKIIIMTLNQLVSSA
ncbi:hypothetical protein V9T40_014445 [Parthenolecanium corni]|uniref:Ketosynthase family 3 (KS3) domain-containing protein n=1 Tax=Parthenolecanium corni TaxID=536013 RepID=A0AAN9TGD6_9HEMI